MSSQSYVPVNNKLSLEPDVENPGLNNSLPLNVSIDEENVETGEEGVITEKQPVVREKQQPTVTAKFMPI